MTRLKRRFRRCTAVSHTTGLRCSRECPRDGDLCGEHRRQKAKNERRKAQRTTDVVLISPTIATVGEHVVTLNKATGKLRCNCSHFDAPCSHTQTVETFLRKAAAS